MATIGKENALSRRRKKEKEKKLEEERMGTITKTQECH